MTGRGHEEVESGDGRRQPGRVKVSDKRRSAEAGRRDAAASEPADPGAEQVDIESLRARVDELTDQLKYSAAEFDNYRKRMMRDQAEIRVQTTATLVRKLLPVLDNFDRAIAHGGDESVGLLRKELTDVLAAEGVEEIIALDAPFDPHVHEAVESRDVAGVREPTVTTVFRAGYRLGPNVLRAAMVGVARPAEPPVQEMAGESTDRSDVVVREN